MRLADFTDYQTGTPIFVDADQVDIIHFWDRSNKDGTTIYMRSRYAVVVREPPIEVANMISQARGAGDTVALDTPVMMPRWASSDA